MLHQQVPEHWNHLRAHLKLQKGYYLLWEHVEQLSELFGVTGDELRECLQYYCDTGE
jgi:hypothetical protein